jgi:hypothetical protein
MAQRQHDRRYTQKKEQDATYVTRVLLKGDYADPIWKAKVVVVKCYEEVIDTEDDNEQANTENQEPPFNGAARRQPGRNAQRRAPSVE